MKNFNLTAKGKGRIAEPTVSSKTDFIPYSDPMTEDGPSYRPDPMRTPSDLS